MLLAQSKSFSTFIRNCKQPKPNTSHYIQLEASKNSVSVLSRNNTQICNYSDFKADNQNEQTKKDSKPSPSIGPKVSFKLPRSGPLSPTGIALFGMSILSLYFYFTIEKQKIELKKSEALKQTTVVGNAKIGGRFELIDQNNNLVTDKNFLGKHFLVYFGFCNCPDICPDELDKIDASDETKDKIVPIFITCDPSRDTPEVIKSYLAEFNSKFVGLTGSFDQVKQVCKAYRVYFSKPPQVIEGQNYLVDHSIFSYLMDNNGSFVDVYGQDRTSQEMAESMKKLLTQ
ncbi:hypothetical protein BB561_003669 [Smittium simulii]|uniref:Thioredoxin domain-containing protein n=1 Tax=Smittium simulii TaxID=133385 RepID=A0A2T9YK26_9FUNG|nr:hypothetical protein BB561_003669 [Smittium simulii]